MRTTRAIVGIIAVICSTVTYGQEPNDSVKIRVKQTYLNEQLEQEDFYDQQGRLVQTSTPNYSFWRGEVLIGHYAGISYEYDTLAYFYVYNEQPPQKQKYRYEVEKGKKQNVELLEEHFYENVLLKEIKHYHTYNSTTPSEYFWYNEHNDLIKEKTEDSTIYLTDYVYLADSLIHTKSKYKKNRDKLFYRREYQYTPFRQIEKIYLYNHDNKLEEIELYFYDNTQKLTTIETTNLGIHIHASQRKERKKYIYYKYNKHGLISEKHIIDDYSKDNRKYNFEYEYY